jgi:hypothetical protein
MGLEVDDDHVRLELLAAAELAREAAGAEVSESGGDDAPDADADRDTDGEPEGGADATPGLAMMLAIYDFLTWLQETLVEALLEPLPRD